MRIISVVLIAFCIVACIDESDARAQTQPNPNSTATNSDAGISQDELQRLAAEAGRDRANLPAADPDNLTRGSLNFLSLLIDGGTLMIPIAIMSLLVVAVTLERFFALRQSRLLPRNLRRELRRAMDDSNSATPQMLFEASERSPSAASHILQDVLQKIGRPVPELEAAIVEGTQREADRLYGNVRLLTLAAAVTPLIGLLGTVWGMIIAFYNTTQLGAGTNKAEVLAEGIYVALVTTLGGLAVAIPAAIFAHYFEGRITKVLAAIDSELRRLVPRFEPLEGKTRYDIGAGGLSRRTAQDNSRRRPAEQELARPKAPPVQPPAARN